MCLIFFVLYKQTFQEKKCKYFLGLGVEKWPKSPMEDGNVCCYMLVSSLIKKILYEKSRLYYV